METSPCRSSVNPSSVDGKSLSKSIAWSVYPFPASEQDCLPRSGSSAPDLNQPPSAPTSPGSAQTACHHRNNAQQIVCLDPGTPRSARYFCMLPLSLTGSKPVVARIRRRQPASDRRHPPVVHEQTARLQREASTSSCPFDHPVFARSSVVRFRHQHRPIGVAHRSSVPKTHQQAPTRSNQKPIRSARPWPDLPLQRRLTTGSRPPIACRRQLPAYHRLPLPAASRRCP
ncbi:hypothetical protein ACLOJK_033000 [Asimina triloba]